MGVHCRPLVTFDIHERLRQVQEDHGWESFYDKLCYLTGQELYGRYILEHYSRDEINEAAAFMDAERDLLFNYSGIDLLQNVILLFHVAGSCWSRRRKCFWASRFIWPCPRSATGLTGCVVSTTC